MQAMRQTLDMSDGTTISPAALSPPYIKAPLSNSRSASPSHTLNSSSGEAASGNDQFNSSAIQGPKARLSWFSKALSKNRNIMVDSKRKLLAPHSKKEGGAHRRTQIVEHAALTFVGPEDVCPGREGRSLYRKTPTRSQEGKSISRSTSVSSHRTTQTYLTTPSTAGSSNSSSASAAPSALQPKPSVTMSPGPRETILDRAFQMRYIPGSKRVPSTGDEKISSIARFEALMAEHDQRFKAKLANSQSSSYLKGWNLDEESDESDSGEVGEDEDDAEGLEMSDQEIVIPTPAQRALDYISRRICPPQKMLSGPSEALDSFADISDNASVDEDKEGNDCEPLNLDLLPHEEASSNSFNIEGRASGSTFSRASNETSSISYPRLNRESKIVPGPDDPRDTLSKSLEIQSQTNSMVDSSVSEDATDWGQDSDLESDVHQLRHGHSGQSLAESQAPVIQVILDPMKEEMVGRLMKAFWTIFDQNWPMTVQVCPAAPGRSPSTSKSISSSSLSIASSGGGSKARQDSGREDDENQDQDQDPEKGDRGGRTIATSLPNADQPVGVACPYRKRNPRKYCVRDWRSCALSPLKTIARVK
jgi:hypothetical protein